eukprot:TRINITY_DN7016_c0_g1_i1.p1 TRINITY_DN7016_c0_g1~~TRINITY_DN7016_c0_g1_i1.p1  ORF type:complete len:352 (+),score=42.14 TRINITY_DN7016_c0_g1_i1:908-1963(+)
MSVGKDREGRCCTECLPMLLRYHQENIRVEEELQQLRSKFLWSSFVKEMKGTRTSGDIKEERSSFFSKVALLSRTNSHAMTAQAASQATLEIPSASNRDTKHSRQGSIIAGHRRVSSLAEDSARRPSVLPETPMPTFQHRLSTNLDTFKKELETIKSVLFRTASGAKGRTAALRESDYVNRSRRSTPREESEENGLSRPSVTHFEPPRRVQFSEASAEKENLDSSASNQSNKTTIWLTAEKRAATSAGRKWYKVVSVLEGRLFSTEDGATEFLPQRPVYSEIAYKEGSPIGGFLVFQDVASALGHPFPEDSRLIFAQKALMRVEVHGPVMRLSSGSYLVSALTPLEALTID